MAAGAASAVFDIPTVHVIIARRKKPVGDFQLLLQVTEDGDIFVLTYCSLDFIF
jgi:hypothetical protein